MLSTNIHPRSSGLWHVSWLRLAGILCEVKCFVYSEYNRGSQSNNARIC